MDLALKNPNRSHWVTIGYGDVEREEVHPILTATIRGTERTIEVEASRYRHSEGMSDWRIFPRDVRPGDGIGEATRREIREATAPIVADWLASGDYRASYRRALAAAIARDIRDANTTADYKARDSLARHGGEITAHDRRRLDRAYRLRMESLRLLDPPPFLAGK